MTLTPQETEFLVSLLRQINVNAANRQAQQTIALTQTLLAKLVDKGAESITLPRVGRQDRSA